MRLKEVKEVDTVGFSGLRLQMEFTENEAQDLYTALMEADEDNLTPGERVAVMQFNHIVESVARTWNDRRSQTGIVRT